MRPAAPVTSQRWAIGDVVALTASTKMVLSTTSPTFAIGGLALRAEPPCARVRIIE